MKNGYDKFFREARKASSGRGQDGAKISLPRKQPSSPRFEITAEQLEQQLRRRAGVRKAKRRRAFPWGLALISAIGVLGAGWAVLNAETVEKFAKRVEISWMGSAMAEEKAEKGKPSETGATKAEEKNPESATREPSAVDIDHFSKLNDRQKELDAREAEISRQESELAKMKTELEKRLADLETMRTKISEMLADRVKGDEGKIDTLVQMYSNMKPIQAAKIFETMDEDLAVEIIGRMKKKNAADIMNLMKAEKAQTFSEKFAGYKRK